MTVATMRGGRLGGMLILIAAVAIAWVIVAFGPGLASHAIPRLIGASAATDASLVETLFTVLVFGALIVVAFAAGALERRNVARPGVAPAPRFAVGLLAGFAGLTVAMLFARLAGTLAPGANGGAGVAMLALGTGVVALQTVAEEIYFRGWLQPALAARWSAPAAVAATSLAFAGLHVFGGARAPVSLVNLLIGGVVFGWFALEGRGIAGAVGVHFAWNASEQLVYGLDPNPGIGSFGAIVDRDLTGAAIWGGSTEGLNGSIGMTAALLAILAPLVLLTWRRTMRQAVAVAPADVEERTVLLRRRA